ncbi:MAG: hypothetical protein JW807_01175 [Spirochaetes bacterium]|nr:hypothetical protein [Spirochaetota bacterium]
MPEEAQNTQPAEQAAAPEGGQAAGKKNKKINRLDPGELSSRIEAIEASAMTGSKYYKHLLQRKRELGS